MPCCCRIVKLLDLPGERGQGVCAFAYIVRVRIDHTANIINSPIGVSSVPRTVQTTKADISIFVLDGTSSRIKLAYS